MIVRILIFCLWAVGAVSVIGGVSNRDQIGVWVGVLLGGVANLFEAVLFSITSPVVAAAVWVVMGIVASTYISRTSASDSDE